MFRYSRRSAISAAVATLAALTLAGCNRMPDTIKIGVAQPLTGGLAGLGKDLVNGVQLAVDELNKQGFKVNGKAVKLEVLAMDDKANADEGKKVAQELVDAGVVAVIGHLNSGVSIAAAPIYAGKGIAQLAISSNPKFNQLGHATALRLIANDDLQARALGSFAAAQIQESKFAVVDDGTLYGKGLAEAAAKQLEGKKTVALRQSFDDKTKDFAALADKIKADGIQVVVSTLNDFQVVALIDALSKIGYNKQITILGTDTLKTSDMVKHADNVGKMFATSSVLEANEFVGGPAFLAAYQSAYKIAPAYGGHYTYDATHILAEAIKKTGSADPAKITETLRKMSGYAPVTGSMKWTDTGEQRYGVVSVYTVRGARWESIVRSDNW
jgi:branched-chain amino acid transport system substrate-binding protein